MTKIKFVATALLCLAAGPALAYSANDGGGTGATTGEGPGGSGAGQTSGGVERLKLKFRGGTETMYVTPAMRAAIHALVRKQRHMDHMRHGRHHTRG